MSVPSLCLLVSGGGRSLESLAERIADGRLDARIALVVSDREDAYALERAERLGIPTRVVSWKEAGGAEAASATVFEAAEEAGCELVVLAGFLRLLRLPPRWRGRVINIHPALLPDFGGKGFYGDRVHKAVLASGASVSGCTVHFVDAEYDHGTVILQRTCPVLPDDRIATLAARVFAEEKEALPEAIRRVLSGEARLPAPAPGSAEDSAES